MPISIWKIFFVAAAIFNVVAGLPLLAAPDLMLQAFSVPVPDSLIFHRVSGFLVICFGIIYWIISREPAKYRAIVWTAVFGKAGVVAILAAALASGTLPFNAFVVALGDVAFVIGFLMFLMQTERAQP